MEILRSLCFCIVLYPFLSLPAWSASHALLIGIQNYTPAGFDALQGPRNDVALVKTLLHNRFGFQESDITVLIDQQATHSGIQHAFARLAAKVQAGDFVYIRYSAHRQDYRIIFPRPYNRLF